MVPGSAAWAATAGAWAAAAGFAFSLFVSCEEPGEVSASISASLSSVGGSTGPMGSDDGSGSVKRGIGSGTSFAGAGRMGMGKSLCAICRTMAPLVWVSL